MTTIEDALAAINAHKSALQARIELLEQSGANADLVITMLVSAIKEIRVTGANTKARRDQVRGALQFAAAHLGEEAA